MRSTISRQAALVASIVMSNRFPPSCPASDSYELIESDILLVDFDERWGGEAL